MNEWLVVVVLAVLATLGRAAAMLAYARAHQGVQGRARQRLGL